MAGKLGTDLAHALRIGRTEIRRSIRAILASQRQLMGFVLLVLYLVGRITSVA
jgi:hypothetical protein